MFPQQDFRLRNFPGFHHVLYAVLSLLSPILLKRGALARWGRAFVARIAYICASNMHVYVRARHLCACAFA